MHPLQGLAESGLLAGVQPRARGQKGQRLVNAGMRGVVQALVRAGLASGLTAGTAGTAGATGSPASLAGKRCLPAHGWGSGCRHSPMQAHLKALPQPLQQLLQPRRVEQRHRRLCCRVCGGSRLWARSAMHAAAVAAVSLPLQRVLLAPAHPLQADSEGGEGMEAEVFIRCVLQWECAYVCLVVGGVGWGGLGLGWGWGAQVSAGRGTTSGGRREQAAPPAGQQHCVEGPACRPRAVR